MIDTISTQVPVQVHVRLLEDDRAIQARIESEYREMPGLSLTLSQAARLFNLEPALCARALDALVTDGALWHNGHEFVRTTTNSSARPRVGTRPSLARPGANVALFRGKARSRGV